MNYFLGKSHLSYTKESSFVRINFAEFQLESTRTCTPTTYTSTHILTPIHPHPHTYTCRPAHTHNQTCLSTYLQTGTFLPWSTSNSSNFRMTCFAKFTDPLICQISGPNDRLKNDADVPGVGSFYHSRLQFLGHSSAEIFG